MVNKPQQVWGFWTFIWALSLESKLVSLVSGLFHGQSLALHSHPWGGIYVAWPSGTLKRVPAGGVNVWEWRHFNLPITEGCYESWEGATAKKRLSLGTLGIS